VEVPLTVLVVLHPKYSSMELATTTVQEIVSFVQIKASVKLVLRVSSLIMELAEDVLCLAPIAAQPILLNAHLVHLVFLWSTQHVFNALINARHAIMEYAQLAFQDLPLIQLDFVSFHATLNVQHV
jgi:hypothetical protein